MKDSSKNKVVDKKKQTDVPKDIRSKRTSGRPSNEERMSNEYLLQQQRMLAADLLAELRKSVKKMDDRNRISLLSTVLKSLSLAEDGERDEMELSLEILGQKYLKMKVQSTQASEETKKAALENPIKKKSD